MGGTLRGVVRFSFRQLHSQLSPRSGGGTFLGLDKAR